MKKENSHSVKARSATSWEINNERFALLVKVTLSLRRVWWRQSLAETISLVTYRQRLRWRIRRCCRRHETRKRIWRATLSNVVKCHCSSAESVRAALKYIFSVDLSLFAARIMSICRLFALRDRTRAARKIVRKLSPARRENGVISYKATHRLICQRLYLSLGVSYGIIGKCM